MSKRIELYSKVDKMKTHRTIRYRLRPKTERKAKQLHSQAAACRWVWNHFVAKLRGDYAYYGECNPYRMSKQNRQGLAGTHKLFTILRRQHPWLREHSFNITRGVLIGLEAAYKQFYKGQGGLPHFKGRYNSEPSIPLVTGTFRLTGESLHVQKIGQVRLVGSNPYPEGKAASGTLKYEAGQWYAYLVYEVEAPEKELTGQAVGLDRNIGQVTTSGGIMYATPEVSRLEARKRRYQRMMARRDAGCRKAKRSPSNRYLNAKTRHQKTSRRLAHARTNWCHRVSRELANQYDLIYLEDLQVKGMTASAKGTAEAPGKGVAQKAGLNKGILGTGWSKLEQCLGYKMQVKKVPPHYTSQRCHACGHTEALNRTTQSTFQCRSCGYCSNADVNAALNILAFGNGAAGRGGGGVTRPGKRQMDRGLRVNFPI